MYHIFDVCKQVLKTIITNQHLNVSIEDMTVGMDIGSSSGHRSLGQTQLELEERVEIIEERLEDYMEKTDEKFQELRADINKLRKGLKKLRDLLNVFRQRGWNNKGLHWFG